MPVTASVNMNTAENTEAREVAPRAKILVVNMNPTLPLAPRRFAARLFEAKGENFEDFPEMMVAAINSPREKPSGSLAQSMESALTLPRVEDVTAIVVTGSSFTAALLKRDRELLGVHGEGKGVFLPDWQKELADFLRAAQERGKPVLGVCFGGEMLAEALGGKVAMLPRNPDGKRGREVGYAVISRTGADDDPVFGSLPESFVGIVNHDYEISQVPPGARILAESQYGVQAFRIGNAWGLQFHPEKDSEDADKLLADPKNEGRFNETEQRQLGQLYSSAIVKTIFTNFLRFAWSGAQ